MKLLVTGAPGWLGTRLVLALIEAGRSVRCLVYPSTDAEPLRAAGADIVFGDVRDPGRLRGCCDGIATVFHTVGVVHPAAVADFYEINVKGTRNVVEEAKRAGVRRLIHVSSNSAVGTNRSREILMTERDEPRPVGHYGRSKLEAERIVNRAFVDGLNATIIRPCWFYGPGQPERQTRFMRMIASGRPVLLGDGDNLRSLSYIDSVVEAMLLAESSDAAIGRTYWIADPAPYSTNEIYATIAGLLGVAGLRPFRLPCAASELCAGIDRVIQRLGFYNAEIHVAGELASDIACSVERAQKELGYAPVVGIREGMRRSIEWCAENGKGLRCGT